jgi:hypothetical protein
LKSELRRLQTFASSQPNADSDWADVEPSVTQYLTRAQESLQAGREYCALQNIGEATVLVQSYMAVQQNAAALKNGLPGFDSHWKKVMLQLSSVDAQSHKRDWSASRAAVRALSEAAQGQSITVLQASRAYAGVTDPKAGYYYLGEAQGDAEFAKFSHQLKLPTNMPPRAFRSVMPEIASLQKREEELFQPPRSIEKHSEFIRLNSTLNLAHELDAANLRFGALYEYLFALQQLALLEIDNAPADGVLRERAAAAKRRLSNPRADDSIAELFVQKVDALLDPNSQALGSPEQKNRSAAAILQRVLPAYYAFVSGPAPQLRKNNSIVTVTLVRWPYT